MNSLCGFSLWALSVTTLPSAHDNAQCPLQCPGPITVPIAMPSAHCSAQCPSQRPLPNGLSHVSSPCELSLRAPSVGSLCELSLCPMPATLPSAHDNARANYNAQGPSQCPLQCTVPMAVPNTPYITHYTTHDQQPLCWKSIPKLKLLEEKTHM